MQNISKSVLMRRDTGIPACARWQSRGSCSGGSGDTLVAGFECRKDSRMTVRHAGSATGVSPLVGLLAKTTEPYSEVVLASEQGEADGHPLPPACSQIDVAAGP